MSSNLYSTRETWFLSLNTSFTGTSSCEPTIVIVHSFAPLEARSSTISNTSFRQKKALFLIYRTSSSNLGHTTVLGGLSGIQGRDEGEVDAVGQREGAEVVGEEES